MINTDIDSIVILNIFDLDYRYIIFGLTKQEAINLLKIADLIENSGSLWNIVFLVKVLIET